MTTGEAVQFASILFEELKKAKTQRDEIISRMPKDGMQYMAVDFLHEALYTSVERLEAALKVQPQETS